MKRMESKNKQIKAMNLTGHRTVLTALLLGLLAWSTASGQSELKVDFTLGGGGEYNIFKSPDVLYSNDAGSYWNADSLIITDAMIDAEYDVDFVREKQGKYLFSTGSDLWYRHYLNNSELSQNNLDVYADYRRILGKSVHLGGYYNFRWSNRVGTSVTGDLLMRSFKYLGNEAMLYLDLLPGDHVRMRLFSNYEYKMYYDENTLDPLDHGNLELNYTLTSLIGKDHELGLELSALDRQYSEYHALNAEGRYDRANPLRHFRYYKAELSYDWRPVRGFRINPDLQVKRRVDLFEGYYSYLSYGSGLRIRYMWDRFYISIYGDYSRMEYDIRPAFTSQEPDPMLVYGYFDYRLTFKYEFTDRWEVALDLDSDNRGSNSDLEYFKTRRGYKNYQALLSLRYTLPDMEWK